MSIEMAVFVRRERIPSAREWQRALSSAELKVELDHEFDPLQFEGFLPASYDGRTGGFEYFLSKIDPEKHGPDLLARLGDRDAVVSLVTHSDFTELMTSVLAAAALAHLVDGILFDTEAGELHTADDALRWAREHESEILPELR